jgi:hypothetical protein
MEFTYVDNVDPLLLAKAARINPMGTASLPQRAISRPSKAALAVTSFCD